MDYIKGYYYHIYNRGNNKQNIFIDDSNYLFLLNLFKKNVVKYSISMTGYCLMPNHYHLLLHQNEDISIARFLKSTFQSYVQAYNKRYKRTGKLFEGRPQAKVVEHDEYMVHLLRYIHVNPLESKIVGNIEDWPYSNYLEYIGKRQGFLYDKNFLSEYFDNTKEYQQFVINYINDAK